MKDVENPTAFVPSASEYILDNFEQTDRIAMLVLNRDFGETVQRITSAQKASNPEFQAWLRYKNANGSDIYIGMNPLRQDASTRTKEDIESIRHVYLDLDHRGTEALESVENSSAVPKPNYVLTSSPGKFQVVWKVEGMSLEEAEGLLHAMAREFGGDPEEVIEQIAQHRARDKSDPQDYARRTVSKAQAELQQNANHRTTSAEPSGQTEDRGDRT